MESSFLSQTLALTTVFILFQFITHVNSCLATGPIPTETNTDYIKKSCNATTYPRLCFKSLSTYANNIKTSPKKLATTALSVTLSATRSASAAMKNLSESQGLSPREAAAVADCVEELGDSVDELRRSTEEMGHIGGGGSEFAFQMNDIETWVSAALTDDDTCMDGFAGASMNGEVKTTVRERILKVAHLASNALALINNYAQTRRLSYNLTLTNE
ncbi:hypothetical protein U1Q18_019441 [Sarracenia purpurea var. burkii]